MVRNQKKKGNHSNSSDNDDTNKSSSNSQKPARKPLPKDLARERKEYTIDTKELDCPGCGTQRTPFSESIYEQLEYVPARLKVIQHVRFKYACRRCQGYCIEASMPNQPIDKGIPGPSLLKEVLINKYQDHLPLYRQEQRFARLGMALSRKTLCNWISQCAFLLKPIVACMIEDLLLSMKLHTDDTIIPVLDKEKTHQGRLWVYLTNLCQAPAICIYQYSPTRTQKVPMQFLENYQGYLQADAYPGYDKLYKSGRIIEVACLAHCRRKFDEVLMQKHPPPQVHHIIQLIAKLYGIEDECRSMTTDKRYHYRRQYAKPIRKKLHAYLLKTKRLVLPKSPLGKAIDYALNHWRALGHYLSHGELSIDNNAAERAIKPVVIGRKNYLFAGSHKAANDAAVIYSIIETCKMNHITAHS